MGDLFTSLGNSMKKDRQAENADMNRDTDYMKTMKAVGDEQLSSFKNPVLTKAQGEEIKSFSDESEASSRALYKQAGMADSSAELESMKHWQGMVEGIKHDMLETTKWESWARGMQSLGMSQEVSRRIALMHTKDREEKIQIYSGLMGAIGGLISKRTGGK